MKLLDGSNPQLALQAGYGSDGMLSSGMGGSIGTGSFTAGFSAYATFSEAITGQVYAGAYLKDLNGDGNQDIASFVQVSVAATPAVFEVFLGNGDGTFRSPTSYQMGTGTSAYGGVLADFNNDGVLDAVATGRNLGGLATVSVRLGVGDGTFGAEVSYSDPLSVAGTVSAADMNNDGIQDIVTASYTNTSAGAVNIHFGNGDGTFRSAISTAAGFTPGAFYGMATADINGDGIMDVAASGRTSGSINAVTVLLGQGDGTLSPAGTFGGIAGDYFGCVLADLNNDGRMDLLNSGTTTGTGGVSTIRLGNGDGTFLAPLSYVMSPQSGNRTTVADINNDGILDMMTGCPTAGYTAGYVGIRFGNGDGTFGAEASFTANTRTVNTVAVGDINNDGVIDLLAGGYVMGPGPHDSVTVLLGNKVDGTAPLLPFSLRTIADARQAMPMLDNKIALLTAQRGGR